MRLRAPDDLDLAPILAVHDPELVEFLSGVVDRWRAAGLPLDAPAIVPWAFPRRPQPASHGLAPSSDILAQVGERCADTITVVLDGTWTAAVAAAHAAATAARILAEGGRLVFAAVRPPGHHAGRSTYGGSCFLNNAAIAAQYLVGQGGRVAVVDLDAHHGNGTQEIFYERADVFYGSIHAEPAHEYPYWCGFGAESGAGPGDGFNRNEPLPAGSGDSAWLAALDRILADVDSFAPDAVVVSLGVDGLAEDPNSTLTLTPGAFAVAGRQVGSLRRPLLGVLEGGYVLELLGPAVLDFLHAADEP